MKRQQVTSIPIRQKEQEVTLGSMIFRPFTIYLLDKELTVQVGPNHEVHPCLYKLGKHLEGSVVIGLKIDFFTK